MRSGPKEYVESLVGSLRETTQKLSLRIQTFKCDFPEMGPRFVFDGTVSLASKSGRTYPSRQTRILPML